MKTSDSSGPSGSSETTPLPDNFVEFLALELELPQERAEQALIELLRDYRPSASRLALKNVA